MNMSEQHMNKPWYRQMWPWLLISGPAIAAIGCMITIYLAVTLYADKPVRDGVIKRGLKVEQLKVERDRK
jgi:hypothetical protein